MLPLEPTIVGLFAATASAAVGWATVRSRGRVDSTQQIIDGFRDLLTQTELLNRAQIEDLREQVKAATEHAHACEKELAAVKIRLNLAEARIAELGG